MGLLGLMLKISKFAPSVPIQSKMLDPIGKLGLEISKEKFAGASLFISFFVGIFTALLALLMSETPLFGLIGFAFAFIFLLSLPGLELKKKSAEFESRLPLVLRTLGMLLDMKIPFARALEIVSYDEPELKPIVEDISKGSTLQKAFSRILLAYDSFAIKRAVSQLISAYEVGSSGKEISRIGDEMLSIQRHALREYASKSAIFGLLFIMSAAVLPTFFLVYSVLGQFTLGSAPEKAMMAIAMLVIFPLISFGILLLAKSMLPKSALESGSSQDYTILMPAGILVLSLLLLPQGFQIIGIGLGCICGGYLVYSKYDSDKRMEEIERHLPDALFAVSSLPKSTRLEDLFAVIERAGYGPLSVEAGKTKKQIGANLSVDAVLEDLGSRNKSPMLTRACAMLRHVFSTNSFGQLNKLGEDMLQFVEVRRERAGLLSMQKYTLVFGGLLVPLILKITLNLLQSMAEFFVSDAGVGTSSGVGEAIGGASAGTAPQLDFAFSLVPAYLIIYALLASFYIANIDERRSQSALYFLAIVVVGLLTFYFLNI